ncbi:hypothetical protein, partial [Mesorhizobium sp. M7A.F.Ca.CA.001.10.2.1]|uniref:hypothetical protein n=1 Tax=Mesorhizobium sp. M7A.F.Ca.CA.001.10.2.1 TaxID=2496720 RepID=UPI0019D162B2
IMVSGTALRAGAPPPATHAPAGGLPAPRIVSQKACDFPVAIAALFSHIGPACGQAPCERV